MELVDICRPSNRVLRGGSAFSSHSYSLDLRLKVLDAVDRGIPRKEVVRTFGVSMPTLERYLRRRRREGAGLDPGRRSPGRTPSICVNAEERRVLFGLNLKRTPRQR